MTFFWKGTLVQPRLLWMVENGGYPSFLFYVSQLYQFYCRPEDDFQIIRTTLFLKPVSSLEYLL